MTRKINTPTQNFKERPKSFEFFDPNQNAKTKAKNYKRFFKYFSYFGIFFLVVMSLVGCIQPFFISVSKKVGAGFELHSSRQSISPYVAIVKYDKKEKQYNLKPDKLDKASNVFLGSPQTNKGDQQINQAIVEETQTQSGDFYAQGVVRVAVNISDNQDEHLVYSESNKNKTNYLAVVNNQQNYTPISKFTNISVVRFKGTISSEKAEDFKELLKPQNLDIFTLSVNEKFEGSIDVFSRDVLQILYQKTRDRLQQEYSVNLDALLAKLRRQNAQLSEEEKDFLFYYNKAITHYLNYLNFTFDQNQKIVIKSDKKSPPLYVGYPGEPMQSFVASSWGEVWEYGPFYALFVWPIFLTVEGISNSSTTWSGWGVVLAIIIVVIVTKLLQFLFTFKTIFSQFKMEELKPKRALIEAKYAPYGKNRMMMQKKYQELSALYKKHNVNPFGMFLPLILTTPVLISVWRVFMASPEIKSTEVASLQFSETSYLALLDGQWQYLVIIVIALTVQLISQLLPRILQRKKVKQINIYEKEALKKQNKIQNLMTVFFVLLSVFFQAGVQFYWTITGIWTIGQHLFVHYFQRTNFFKTKIKPRL